jgi:YggT family protein
MLALGSVLNGVAAVLYYLLFFYQWILIARAIISWVSADPRNPIVGFLHAVTDPALRVIRRRLPTSLRYFPLDVAFLVLFALVIFGLHGIVPMLQGYARALMQEPRGQII